MVQIGRINKLTVKRIRDYDVYLDGGELGDILLPLLELPENCQVNDEVEVFVYNESEGRLQATIQTPRVMVGQVAKLQVVTNATTGSYLNWGLKKDLFAPRSQQLVKMEEGQSYVIFVFLDKRSNRITASSKLDKLLSQEPPRYAEGEEVDLLIYDTTDLGYKAVVNKTHGGMLYKNEVFQKVVVGQSMKGFIKKVREDGKIDLILQQSGYQGVDDIS
ncbi:MAG: GntR family transcriptional regulator, partial [Desulfobulbaceae bacterium]|nr:GntR family transcriptional regulator [Candidatus Desulfatifera sulfidica]